MPGDNCINDQPTLPRMMASCSGSNPEEIPGESGVSSEDLDAYRANYSAHRIGISLDQCVQSYDQLADKYEQTLSLSRYQGPLYAAQATQKYNTDTAVRILDVAAGTGLVGEQLRRLGFDNIDALEPSSQMLMVAGDKSIYRRLICDKIADSQTDIPDDSYDMVVISGGMGEGHVPCVGLLEIIRVVKPGGVVVIVMREEYLDYVQEYKDRLEPLMADLEQTDVWCRLERTVATNYSFGKNGIVFVFRVQVPGRPNCVNLTAL